MNNINIENKSPKVSIIVPVYNAENFLDKCIDSILAQDYSDFELLLIDDGSKDSSGKICDKYALKDRRVRAFHNANGGVSSARNVGVLQAKGEWIVFIDADDWITKDYIKELVTASDSTDFVISGFQYVQNDGSKVVSKYSDIVKPDISVIVDDEIFCKPHLMSTPWCKMYKTGIIRDNNLQFDEMMIIGEDNCFVNDYICCVNNIKFKDYVGYMYRLPSDGGIVRKYKMSPDQFFYHINHLVNSFERVSEVLGIDMQKTIANEKKIFCNVYVEILKSLKYFELKRYLRESKRTDLSLLFSVKLSLRKRIQFYIAFHLPIAFYMVAGLIKLVKYMKV